MKKILVIGATSAIAQAAIKCFADLGDSLFLVARNAEKLSIVVDDAKVMGAGHIEQALLDLDEYEKHPSLIKEVVDKLGGLDVALIAHGTLPDQLIVQQSYESTLSALTSNGLSVISLLTELGNYFEQQKKGVIVAISSVAGDRGRQSNYIYGTAKAMVSTFLQGLRNRLHKNDVQVITIKPGFVDTPMTADFKKGLLWVKPEAIAKSIIKAIDKKQDVVYAPYFWWFIMAIIKSIPEKIFKRLSL